MLRRRAGGEGGDPRGPCGHEESGTHPLLLTQCSPSTQPLRPLPARARWKASPGLIQQKGLSDSLVVHPAIPSTPHSCTPAPEYCWTPVFPLISPSPWSGTQASGSPPSGLAGREPRLYSLPAALFLSHCVWDRGGARASTGEPPPLPKEKARALLRAAELK